MIYVLSMLAASLGFAATAKVSGITNPELRAEMGSGSKVSVSSSLSYSGGGIDDPLSREKPNPNNESGDFRTSMSGSIGLRYRMNKATSIKAGTGLTARAPFHGVEEFETQTPRISIDYFQKFGTLQSKSEARVDIETTSFAKKIGAVSTLKLRETIKQKVGRSRFTVGSQFSFNYYFYNRDFTPADGNVSAMKLGMYPKVEYRINDTFRLQSSIALEWKNFRRDEAGLFFPNRLVNNWLGVGTSLTPEIYMYPYVQWYPQEARPETSTFNVSLTLNVF